MKRNLCFKLKVLLMAFCALLLVVSGALFAVHPAGETQTARAAIDYDADPVRFFLYNGKTEINPTSLGNEKIYLTDGENTVRFDKPIDDDLPISTWTSTVLSISHEPHSLFGYQKVTFANKGLSPTGSWFPVFNFHGDKKRQLTMYMTQYNGLLAYACDFTYIWQGSGTFLDFGNTSYTSIVSSSNLIPKAMEPNTSPVTMQYTGSPQPLELNGAGVFFNVSYSSGSAPTEVGEYTVTLTPKDSYRWSNYSKIPKTIKYTITGASLDSDPEFIVAPGLIYNGKEQAGVTVAEGAGYTLTGDKAVEAGEYTATLTLKPNFSWKDGATAPKTQKWSIAQADQNFTVSDTTLAGGQNEVTAPPEIPDDTYFTTGEVTVKTDKPEIATASYDAASKSVIVKRTGDAHGTVQVTLSAAGDKNLKPSEVTFNAEIKANSGFMFEGNIYEDWAKLSAALSEYKGETAVVSVVGAVELSSVTVPANIKNLTLTAGEEATITATGDGALITVAGGLNLTLGKNLTVQCNNNNTLAAVTGGSLTVEGAQVQNFGTAISVTGGTAKITGGTFANNQSAVAVSEEGALTVEGGDFTQNTSSAIAISGGTAQITGGNFKNNTAQNGAAINAQGGKLTVEGGDFSGNVASSKGGAIYVAASADVKISGGNIYNNSAEFGAGVALDDGAKIGITSAAVEAVTDSFGIIGSTGYIDVTGGQIQNKLTVEFTDPSSQLSSEHLYVQSSDNSNSVTELKAQLRVKNPGYTFGTDQEGGLTLTKANSNTATWKDSSGTWHDCVDLQTAINEAAAAGVSDVYLMQYKSSDGAISNTEVEIDKTIVVPQGANIILGAIVREATEGGANFTYRSLKEDEEPTKLIRDESLTAEMIRVKGEGKLTLKDVVLDGGAVWNPDMAHPDGKEWTSFEGTNIKITDQNGAAGSAKTNNAGVTAHAPVIVNEGSLAIEGATIQNNDNNYAAPGVGFGSQNYGGGVRNQGAGQLTFTSGTIKDCYSREGAAIMNVNKPTMGDGVTSNEEYVKDGNPTVTVKEGAVIGGNVSQQKGAAVQSIYGGANTVVEGGTFKNNHSLNNLGVLSVEEGASLTVSGGTITAAEGKNALYLYNKYSEADILGSSAGATPYVEGNTAASLTVSGGTIGGNVHIDDPCTPYNHEDNPYEAYVDVTGYTGGTLTLDVNSNRAGGKLAVGGKDKVTVPANQIAEDGLSGTYFYTDTNGDLLSGKYSVTFEQTEPGKITVKGSCDGDATLNFNGQTITAEELAAGKELIFGNADNSGLTIGFTYADGTEVDNVATDITLGVVQFNAEDLTLALPAGATYVDEDGVARAFVSGMLPNDIAVDQHGNITVKVGEEERTVHIGTRAGKTQDLGKAELPLAAASKQEDGKYTLTVQGEDGLEYRLMDDKGNFVGEWITCTGGAVTFKDLAADGASYTVVARNPKGEYDLPGAYATQGTLTALTSDEAEALTLYTEAYGKAEGALWTAVEEDGVVNVVVPQTKATSEVLNGVVNAYNNEKFTQRLKDIPEIANGYKDVLLSRHYALANEWETKFADLLGHVKVEQKTQQGEDGRQYTVETVTWVGDDAATLAGELKNAIEEYEKLYIEESGQKDYTAQSVVEDKFNNLLTAYKSAAADKIQAEADKWFEENNITSDTDKANYSVAVDLYKGMAQNHNLTPRNEDGSLGDVAKAIDELNNLAARTTTALQIQQAYNTAVKDNLALLSDAKQAELNAALVEWLNKVQTGAEDLANAAKDAQTQFELIVAKGKAEKQYLDAYLAVNGKSPELVYGVDTTGYKDPAVKEVIESINKAENAQAAAQAAKAGIEAMVGSLKDGLTADSAAYKYVDELSKTITTDVDEFLNGAKNLNAVVEYLNAYKNINGAEADTTQTDIKEAIANIQKGTSYTTADPDNPDVDIVSTDIESANRALYDEVAKLLKKAYKDSQNDIIGGALKAVKAAEEEGNRTKETADGKNDGKTQNIAKVADAVLGVAEKLSVQNTYDQIEERSGKTLTAEELADLKKDLAEDLTQIDGAEDKASAAKKAQEGLLLKEAKYLAGHMYAQSYKEITGKESSEDEKQAVAGKLTAAETVKDLNQVLEDALTGLLGKVATTGDSAAVKDIVKTATDKVQQVTAEAGETAIGKYAEAVKDVATSVSAQRTADVNAAKDTYKQAYKALTGEDMADEDPALAAIGKATNAQTANAALMEQLDKLIDNTLTSAGDSQDVKAYLADVKKGIDSAIAAADVDESRTVPALDGKIAVGTEQQTLAEVKATLDSKRSAEREAAVAEYLEAYKVLTGDDTADDQTEAVKQFASSIETAKDAAEVNGKLKDAVSELVGKLATEGDSSAVQAEISKGQQSVQDVKEEANGISKLTQTVKDIKTAVDNLRDGEKKAIKENYDQIYERYNGKPADESDKAAETAHKAFENAQNVTELNEALKNAVDSLLNNYVADDGQSVQAVVETTLEELAADIATATQSGTAADITDKANAAKDSIDLSRAKAQAKQAVEDAFAEIDQAEMSPEAYAAIQAIEEAALEEIDNVQIGEEGLAKAEKQITAAKDNALADMSRKAAEGIAQKQYEDSYKAITGKNPTADEKQAFATKVQAAQSNAGVNEELKKAVDQLLDGLLIRDDNGNVTDSATTQGLVSGTIDEVATATQAATQSNSVPDLAGGVVNDIKDRVAQQRAQEKADQTAALDQLAEGIDNLPEDLKELARQSVQAAKDSISDGNYSDYPLIEEKARARLDLIQEAAAQREREGAPKDGQKIDEALQNALDDIGNSSSAEDVASAKQCGSANIEKEYQKQKLTENTANDSAYVKEQAQAAMDEIDRLNEYSTTPEQVQAVADKYAPAIEGERFLDNNDIARKPFADIVADDKPDYEGVQDAFGKTTEEVKDYLNDKYKAQPYNYTDGFEGALEDAVNKAEFEQDKAQKVGQVKELLKECDGEYVKEANRKGVEELSQESYDAHADGATRDSYKADRANALEDKFNQAKQQTEHAQGVQRRQKQAQAKVDELAQSGKYSDEQKDQMQDILDKFIDDSEDAAVDTEQKLDKLLEDALKDLWEVPVQSATCGDILPNKAPSVSGGTGDYGEDHTGGLWGIVTNPASMPGDVTLHIDRLEELNSKQVKSAISKKNYAAEAANGQLLAGQDLGALVAGKEVIAAIDVYLTRGDVRVEEYNGTYLIKVLLPAELRTNGAIQVVRVLQDGKLEVFKTEVENGRYVVFTAATLSQFSILGEKRVDLTWLIVLLSVVIALELMATAIVLLKRKKEEGDGSNSKAAAVAPLALLTIYTPVGAVEICIALGLCVVIAAELSVIALLFKKYRSKNSGDGNKEAEEAPQDQNAECLIVTAEDAAATENGDNK